MIKRLYVDNYKSLMNFELPLRELSLLLGPNGVGKTAVLDVVLALRKLLSGAAKVADAAIFPTSTLTRWQTRNQQVFELDLGLEGDEFQYRLELAHERTVRRSEIALEELSGGGQPLFRCKKGKVQLYRDDHAEGVSFDVDKSESALARVAPREDNKRLTRFLEFVRKIIVCGMQPADFATESASEDAILERDGRNFAAWYRHLLLERQDLAPGFTKSLQQVIDGFQDIRLEKVGLDTRALMVGFRESDGRYELRLDELSDGQRAIIALYALVRLAAGQGCALLLDEPENYVALAEIQPWLVELLDACGDGIPQAVLCSHHPELIDYLGVDRGLIFQRQASGVTTVRALEAQAGSNGLKLSEIIARGWQR